MLHVAATLSEVKPAAFEYFAPRTVDEALSLLVGEPAGESDENGEFPEGSVNARVVERLRVIAEMISEDDIKEAEKELAQKALAEPSVKHLSL